ncbi:DNRLRE domain-containing protein [candidate division WOR-3 bacterium]|nr:DNRLRE domain-containing protein [candidate division WOR-3 bacterium]
MKRYTVITLTITLCIFLPAFADDATLDAEQDCFVSGMVPDVPSGPEVYIAVAADWELEFIPPTKSLIQFDIASLGDILEVQDATLRLHVTNASAAGELEIFRAGGSWNEMTTTWNTRPAEDRGESSLVTPTGLGQFEVDVTDIVQSWVAGFPNNGFYIDAPDNDMAVDLYIASKEATAAGTRPKLQVTFTPGGGAVSENEFEERILLNVSHTSSGTIGVNFTIPFSAQVSLKVYDARGSLVETLVDGPANSGDHYLAWEGSPGVYFVQLLSPGTRTIRKVVLID